LLGLRNGAKSDRRKISRLAVVGWPRNEADDIGAHDRISVITTATRPSNASDIRYAVMRSPLENKCAADRGGDAIVSGANPILIRGPQAALTTRRPTGAFAHTGHYGNCKGSDGSAACGAQASALGRVRAPEARAAVRLVNFGKQKARGDLSRGPVNFFR
jgi:hypothetical protein